MAPLALSLVVLAPAPATAQSEQAVQEAKSRFQLGKTHYDRSRYRQAIMEFEAGYELVKKSAFLLNIGQCYRRLGNVAKARDYYARALAEDPSSKERGDVEKIIAELDAELGKSSDTPKKALEPEPVQQMGRAASASETPEEPSSPSTPASEAPAFKGESTPSSSVRASALPRRATDGDEGASGPPIYKRAWFWTAVGVVVAGGIAGALFATLGDAEYQKCGTLTGCNPIRGDRP